MNEYDLSFGSDVHCTDGKCGRLQAVAANRDAQEVTHLIVAEGFLLKKARVFPINLVAHVGETIDLSIASHAAADYPYFREEVVETAAEGGGGSFVGGSYHVSAPPVMVRQKVRYGVPEERAVLERGLAVISPDGREGKLEHLLVDADSHRITGLVLQSGVLFTSQRVVPAEMIETISETGIYINATPEQMESLQPYVREDADGPRNGETSPAAARVVEESPVTAEGPGYRVAQALDRDPRTADSPIEVIFERGIVTLSGTVDSPQTRATAEAIAASQPGVISVVNELKLDL